MHEIMRNIENNLNRHRISVCSLHYTCFRATPICPLMFLPEHQSISNTQLLIWGGSIQSGRTSMAKDMMNFWLEIKYYDLLQFQHQHRWSEILLHRTFQLTKRCRVVFMLRNCVHSPPELVPIQVLLLNPNEDNHVEMARRLVPWLQMLVATTHTDSNPAHTVQWRNCNWCNDNSPFANIAIYIVVLLSATYL